MNADVALQQIRTILDTGGEAPLRVTGTSMVPFLRHRKDFVTLTAFDGHVRPGDILFYLTHQGRPILHRYHKTLPDGRMLICGDNQTRPDFVSPEQVLAKACRINRNGRQFSADTPLWRGLSLLWIRLFPVRKPLLNVIQWVWKVLKK